MRSFFPCQRLSSSTFRDALRASPYLLVRVEVGSPSMHRGVPLFFDRQYPRLFSFGTLPVQETRKRDWWDEHFRTSVGPAKGGRVGYWLFQEAQVVGHHSGLVRTDLTFTDRRTESDDAQRAHSEIAWIKRIAFDDDPVSSVDLAAAVEIIAYFDGIMCVRQSRAGFGDGATRDARSTGRPARVTPQNVPIPGASGDPFQILCVHETASDDEVRRAYRNQLKLNHPDKVSHMSADIQEYANAKTRVIKAAYDAITSVRK